MTTADQIYDAPDRNLTAKPTGSCPFCWKSALNTTSEYARSVETGFVYFRCRRCGTTHSEELETLIRQHPDPLVKLRAIPLPRPVC